MSGLLEREAGRRAVACEAARQVIAELEASGDYPAAELDRLHRHYRRIDRRLDRD